MSSIICAVIFHRFIFSFNPDFVIMTKLLAALYFSVLFSGVCLAAATPVSADDVAHRLVAMSGGQDVTADDPRVAQTRKLLDKAVKLTQEEPMAIAAASSRYAGHLFDSIHERATALELLEALAAFGKRGRPMSETLQGYVAARKAAPGKSHAEAMAKLGMK
jgi:hypothetical protein